jgi:glutaredoxin
MKKWLKVFLILLALLAVFGIFNIMRTNSGFEASGGAGGGGGSIVDKGNLIVYGSKSCPWCIKQEDYLMKAGMPYTFVDCEKEHCPDFVSGFPTLLLNNQVMTGYKEFGPPLSEPSPLNI